MRSNFRRGIAHVTAVALVAAPVGTADAQILKKIREKAAETVGADAARRAEALLAVAIRCVFDDAKCVERAKAQDKPVVLTDEDGNVITDGKGAPVTDPGQVPPEVQRTAQDTKTTAAPASELALPPVEDGRFRLALSPWSDLGLEGTAVVWVRPSAHHERGESRAILRFCYRPKSPEPYVWHGHFQPIFTEGGEWRTESTAELAMNVFEGESGRRTRTINLMNAPDRTHRLEQNRTGFLDGWIRGAVPTEWTQGIRNNSKVRGLSDVPIRFALAFSAEVRNVDAFESDLLACPGLNVPG